MKKNPSDRSTSRAGKTLRNKRASKAAKSLAGTVLALDPNKGTNRKPPKTMTRSQYARAVTLLWLEDGKREMIHNPAEFSRTLAKDRRQGKPHDKGLQAWDRLWDALRSAKAKKR